MASDWRVHCIQNTHRHPLWCWTHWDCCPNSEQTEVYLKKRENFSFYRTEEYWNLWTKISALLYQMKFKCMRMKNLFMVLPLSTSQPFSAQTLNRLRYIWKINSFYSKKKIWKFCDNYFFIYTCFIWSRMRINKLFRQFRFLNLELRFVQR